MSKGRYGIHGGQYISETLMNELIHLEECYEFYKKDAAFQEELNTLLNEYAGRPSLLYYAEKMTKDLGGAKIYLKREDLNHTGSHKINNVLGQALLAKKMGKTRVIAETGAGQHGVATATAAALMGMECEVFMGKEDTERQALNVYRMELLGAKVHPVTTGTRTLKDAVICSYAESGPTGSAIPIMCLVLLWGLIRSRLSYEISRQSSPRRSRAADSGKGRKASGMQWLPVWAAAAMPWACSITLLRIKDVQLIGCEAAGKGVDTALTAATIAQGSLVFSME